MKKSVLLAFVLFSLCVVGLLRLQIAYASPYINVDVETAYNMITNGSYPDLVVLDVRTKIEYDNGHIYGAVWIPLSELEERIGELAGHEDHEIIVYCECGASGGRSEIASGILDSYNFTKVYNMLGGILAWKTAGYPVRIATVHNVDTTFNYDTIQAAIDALQTLEGHTILVDAGTYYEHVVVKKSISLIGENRSTTVIDGNGTGDVIYTTARHVNVTGFTIRNGTNGISIIWEYNIIGGNIVTDNQHGINISATCPCCPARGNIIRNNIIENNSIGIHLKTSSDNVIYHNNFINNINSCLCPLIPLYKNIWDGGYPSGGNYWSDYNGTDLFSGPYQNESGSDGIGDEPYIIDEINRDRYPLMYPWSPLPVHNINTWSGYATIQEAINANETLDGHVIFVETGTYSEHANINKSISLIGENRSTTIIDGKGSGDVVTVASPNIVLTGFTIRNSSVGKSGIWVEGGSHGSTILGNKITDCSYGVSVHSSFQVEIVGNEIYSITTYGIDLTNACRSVVESNKITNGTTGLVLHASYGNNISNNMIADLRYGLLLYNSGNNTLRNNNMTGNERNFGVGGGSLKDYLNDVDVSNTVNGLPIVYLVNQSNLIVDTVFPQAGYMGIVNSQNITVKNQNLANNLNGLLLAYTNNSKINNVNISNNRFGVDLWFSNNNTVTQSTLYNNDNEYAAIRLIESSSNSIKNTVITNCGTGFQVIYSSDGNVITDNVVSNNQKGFQISDSNGNKIYHNNFINNTVHVENYDSTNTWDNGYPSGGNYWSNYTDVDVKSGPNQDQPGSDGIGDTPYIIDENNRDNYPLMHPWTAPPPPPPDTTPPTISIISPENKTYPVNDVPLTFTVSETTSWIGYGLDGQANVTIAVNTTLSGLSEGPHSLIVYAKDTAGNTGASEIIYFTIKTQQANPFPTWIVAAIVIIAVVGAALLVYFAKAKKKLRKSNNNSRVSHMDINTAYTHRAYSCHIYLQTKTNQNTIY